MKWDEGPCYICGANVAPADGWHREDFDGKRRHWCPEHRPVWSHQLPTDAVRPIPYDGPPVPTPEGICPVCTKDLEGDGWCFECRKQRT